ncbi:PI-PLC X domain-containing protein 1-like [Amphibalanus amphitrite]|uniref:PI-PLC X domain-containing protein 1-like n=1 Tax=Amphibalanus amphitrite TaxID=1232801 RepID=UPI001C90BBC2|nr:PI-PLC X domain-containing protein 1-like [Amphibalanus amphitrite]XP_043191659.1 PI-PLC X domain-containing protein 1-like [Amphibalanus amphitrite]
MTPVWSLLLLLIGGMAIGHDVTARQRSARPRPRLQSVSQPPCPGDDVTDVFIVINSVGLVDDSGAAIWRRLELVWHTAQVQPDDQVLLYDSCTPDPASDPVVTVTAADHSDHFFVTDVTLPTFNFSGTPAVSTCLGYCTEYRRDGASIASSCLSSRPDWMSQMAADIQDFHLHEVMLPGTHDAASYTNYRGESSDDDLLQRYASAQEETLLSQFYLGARYFDVRVLFAPTTAERFWVSHGLVPFRPFHIAIDDLVAMMEASTEIVIYEIGGFEGSFDSHPEAYEELLSLVVPRLERWLAPRPAEAPHHVLLSDLWAADTRLVLSWDRDPAGRDYLWPRVPNSWNNDDTPEALYETLRRAMDEAPRDEIWALAGEMTEHTSDIVFDRLESLRQMADLVNRNVSRMVRYDWWDKSNIVMADYFMGTYNVDTALLVNWQRAHC